VRTCAARDYCPDRNFAAALQAAVEPIQTTLSRYARQRNYKAGDGTYSRVRTFAHVYFSDVSKLYPQLNAVGIWLD
jgi:hypothetical protein